MNSGASGASSRAGLILVLAVAAVLPWALGGTPLWAYRVAGFVLVSALAADVWRRGAGAVAGLPEAAWLWPAAGLAAVALLQSVPLPLPAVRALSPAAAAAWEEAVAPPGGPSGAEAVARLEERALAAVPEAAQVPVVPPGGFPFTPPDAGRSVRATVSYHPAATRERLVWFVALLCAFVVVRQSTSRRGGRGLVRGVLLGNAALLALAAMAFRIASPGTVLGSIEPLRGGNPYGPYVNPTHFAFLMELAVPWLAALAWQGHRRTGRALSAEVLLPAAWAGLCAAAAIGSGSKGAAFLLSLALAVVAAAAIRRAGRKLRVLGIAAAVLAGMAFLVLVSPARERIADFAASGGFDFARSDRVLIWSHAARLVVSHPILGTGFGAFRHVIPAVLPAGEAQPWHQLHNDFLEVAVGGGGAAAALLGALVWGYGRRAFQAVRSADDDRLERLGILVGVGAVTLHALFDFGHQMPANALFFVIAAARVVPVRPDRRPTRRASGVAQGAAILAVLAGSGLFAAQGVPAGFAFAAGTRAAAAGRFESATPRLDAAAVGTDRFEALWTGGDVRLGRWDRMSPDEAYLEPGAGLLESAAHRFLEADREVAGSGWPLQALGSTYRRVERADAAGRPFDLSWIEKSPWASVGRHGRIAIGLHRLALDREPMVAAHRDALIVSLLDLGLKEEAAVALREAARLQPILVQHQGLAVDRLDDELVAAFHEGAKEALGRVPMTQTQRHLLALGQTAYRLGRYDEATSWLTRALEAPADRISRAEARWWLAITALQQGRPDDAQEWYETTVDVPNFREASLAGLARLARERGDLQAETAYWDTLRREVPGVPGYIVSFADAAVRAGRRERAVEVLRAAAARRPDDATLGVALAETLFGAGEVRAASREIERLEGRFPGDPRVSALRERARAATGRP